MILRLQVMMGYVDMAVTSQGRTIFEMACMGIPSVVLSQNPREVSHSFANLQNGFCNLGLGETVSESVIFNTLCWLIDTAAIRKNMRALMLKNSLRSGIKRVCNIILDERVES